MKIIIASIVAILSLTALPGCDSEGKAGLSQLKQDQQAAPSQPAPPKQIVIPPYTKPIPRVGDAKMKLPD